MFARGFASGKSLRAFLIACAVALGTVASARALDTVTMTFNSITNYNGSAIGNSYNGGAGQFNWTVTASAGLGTTVFGSSHPSPGATFCIQTNQNIGYGGSYTYNVVNNTGLSTLPIPGGGMGVRADYLQALATILTSVNAYTAPNVQAAIWNIVNATNAFAYTGGNHGTDVSSTVVNGILTDVFNKWNSGPYTATGYFYGLASETNQDQIVLVNTSGNSTPPVPAPAGVVLAGMAFACVGGYNFLRRRKAIAVA